jgi:YidC/Oxa1 family membrane protein insertase
MMERRQVLAVVLMFLVLVIYQVFYVERFQKRPKVKKPPAQVEEPAKPPEPEPLPPPPPPEAEVPPAKAGVAERLVRVRTDLFEATFSTRGAAMVSYKLLDYPKTPGKSKEPVDLVPAGERALLVAFEDPEMDRYSTEGAYAVSADGLEIYKEKPSGELTLTHTGPKGERIVKRLTFHVDRYSFDLDLYVERPDGARGPLDHRVHWSYGLGGGNAGYGSYTTVSRLVEKKRLKDKPGKLPPLTVHPGEAAWSGIQTKYFAAVLAPRTEKASAAVAKRTTEKMVTKTSWTFQKTKVLQKVAEVAPGLAFSASGPVAREQVLVFGGPKLPQRLKVYGGGLDKVIDYGWFGPLSRPLLKVLSFINGFVGNWGVSIILLTVMIKLMFFPLSIKQQKNMAQMSKLQPKLKALQQRYKDDKQKLNQEIMGLYRQEKVNPLGGCLPLLIQFPVIIALYRVLGDALALRGAPFALWINDLSVPDTLFYPWLHILPILMGATMLIQNFISPASAMGGAGADPRQAQMLKFMPIIFLFIFWKFPAGLNLYWTVYTILGIGEQVIIRRQTALQEARAS